MATATVETAIATFDADNHYYEATDAFTRHIDPRMAKRAMQWAEINGRQRLLVGGKICKFIPNPTFDPWPSPAVSTSTSAAAIRSRTTSGTSSGTLSRSDPSTAIVTPGWQ